MSRAVIFNDGKFQGVGNNGQVIPYGKLHFNKAGTGEPIETFRDSLRSSPNTYPINLSASGKADVFLLDGTYDVTLKDKNGVTVWTINNFIPSGGNGTDLLGSYTQQFKIEKTGITGNTITLDDIPTSGLNIHKNGLLLESSDYNVGNNIIVFTDNLVSSDYIIIEYIGIAPNITNVDLQHKEDTIADFRAMIGTPEIVYVSGYHNKNDGAFGSNFFKLRAGAVPDGSFDNGGTVIETVNGVYDLQFDGAVNVKWFGNTQSALDSRNSIKFNNGEYSIDTTILTPTSPNNDGFSITGTGISATDPLLYPTARARTSSVLKWGRETGGTMFEVTDTLGLEIRDITLHGNNVADVLIHFKFLNQGSGLASLSNLGLFGARTLISCGTLPEDGTCADILLNHIQMTDATYGLEVLNYQGLNYNVIQPSANNIESVIRMKQGGSLNISMANFVNCGNDANGNYSIHLENTGDNSFNCLIDTIRFEQGCENFFFGQNYGTSIINGLTEATAATQANKIKLIGHNLTINDSMIRSWDNLVTMIGYNGKNPSIVIKNTYFNSTKTFEEISNMFNLDVNNQCYISIINCKVNDGTNKPIFIKDFFSSLKLGSVIHEGTATGNNVSTMVYLFNETSQNRYNTLELYNGVTTLKSIIVGVETTTGDKIGATLEATINWDGDALTVLNTVITNTYNTGEDSFNTASYETSLIGARVSVVNPSTGAGTWKYIVETSRM